MAGPVSVGAAGRGHYQTLTKTRGSSPLLHDSQEPPVSWRPRQPPHLSPVATQGHQHDTQTQSSRTCQCWWVPQLQPPGASRPCALQAGTTPAATGREAAVLRPAAPRASIRSQRGQGGASGQNAKGQGPPEGWVDPQVRNGVLAAPSLRAPRGRALTSFACCRRTGQGRASRPPWSACARRSSARPAAGPGW